MDNSSKYIFALMFLCFFLVFTGRFIYYHFLTKRVRKRIFTNKWGNNNGQVINRETLLDTIIEITNTTRLGLSIIEHTTANIDGDLIPIIFGHISFPTMHGIGRRTNTKGFYSFSSSGESCSIFKKYTSTFELVFEFGETKIYFINHVKNLEKLLLLQR